MECSVKSYTVVSTKDGKTSKFGGLERGPKVTRQRLEEVNQKKFDVLDYSVTAFLDKD